MSQKSEFLWETIRFLENRIAMTDTKAAIIIGVETGLFGFLTIIADKFISASQWSKYAILVPTVLFTGAIILLLLWTIRPTNFLFRRKLITDLKQKSAYLLWPPKPNKNEFYDRLNKLDDAMVEDELAIWVFNCHQLLHRKYKSYSNAIFWVKVQIVSTFGLLLLCIILHLLK